MALNCQLDLTLFNNFSGSIGKRKPIPWDIESIQENDRNK
jgi:hypothetical protein